MTSRATAPSRGPGARVRSATIADARAIAEIRVASWRATYRGIVPTSILEGMDVDRDEVRFRGRLANPGLMAFVAEDVTGSVIGFVMAGAARDDDAAGLGEVYAIYLAPGARGRGVGRALMDAALEALEASGFSTAILWVLTANEPARRFYERAGFQLDGTARDLDFDGTPVEEIRYRRADSGRARTIVA
ncbi:MAG: GNAT family N-acetyltransferase [Chloroflexota bacterium]|nr:MAG: GNAT family N-acetyltransferase [Chloroflexota bacterium]